MDRIYRLYLPPVLHEEVERYAKKFGTTALHLYQQILKLGLFADAVDRDPNQDLCFRCCGKTRILDVFGESPDDLSHDSPEHYC